MPLERLEMRLDGVMKTKVQTQRIRETGDDS